MKVDFHVHSTFNNLMFKTNYTRLMLDTAIKEGLDAIILVERSNSLALCPLYQYLNDNFKNIDNVLIYNNLKIFTGMEIEISSGSHVLMIASIGRLLKVYKLLLKEKEYDLKKLFAISKNEDRTTLLIGAHPFNRKHNFIEYSYEELQFLDAFQLNVDEPNSIFKQEKILTDHKFPVVIGSDSHNPLLLGSGYSWINCQIENLHELKQHLREFQSYIADDYQYKYKYSRLASKSIKKLLF